MTGRTEYSQHPTISGIVNIPSDDPTGLWVVFINDVEAAVTEVESPGTYSFSTSLTGLTPGNTDIRIEAYDNIGNVNDIIIPVYIASSPTIKSCLSPGQLTPWNWWSTLIDVEPGSCAGIYSVQADFDGTTLSEHPYCAGDLWVSLCYPFEQIGIYIPGLLPQCDCRHNLFTSLPGPDFPYCFGTTVVGQHTFSFQATDMLGNTATITKNVFNVPTAVAYSSPFYSNLFPPNVTISQLFSLLHGYDEDDPFYSDPSKYINDSINESLSEATKIVKDGKVLYKIAISQHSVDHIDAFSDFLFQFSPDANYSAGAKFQMGLKNPKTAFIRGYIQIEYSIPYPEFYSCPHFPWICTRTAHKNVVIWGDYINLLGLNLAFSFSLVPYIDENGHLQLSVEEYDHKGVFVASDFTTIPIICSTVNVATGSLPPNIPVSPEQCTAAIEILLNKLLVDYPLNYTIPDLASKVTETLKKRINKGLPCILNKTFDKGYGYAYCCPNSPGFSIDSIDQIPLVDVKWEKKESQLSSLLGCVDPEKENVCPPSFLDKTYYFLNLYYQPCAYIP